MRTANTVLKKEKLGLAIQRLELFLEPATQQLLDEFIPQQSVHLPELSKQLKQSPFKLKQQLDRLKEAGLVYSPKRFPKAFAVNQIKCVKINLKARVLTEV